MYSGNLLPGRKLATYGGAAAMTLFGGACELFGQLTGKGSPDPEKRPGIVTTDTGLCGQSYGTFLGPPDLTIGGGSGGDDPPFDDKPLISPEEAESIILSAENDAYGSKGIDNVDFSFTTEFDDPGVFDGVLHLVYGTDDPGISDDPNDTYDLPPPLLPPDENRYITTVSIVDGKELGTDARNYVTRYEIQCYFNDDNLIKTPYSGNVSFQLQNPADLEELSSKQFVMFARVYDKNNNHLVTEILNSGNDSVDFQVSGALNDTFAKIYIDLLAWEGADQNYDREVTLSDISRFCTEFLTTDGMTDLNGDNFTNLVEYATAARKYLIHLKK